MLHGLAELRWYLPTLYAETTDNNSISVPVIADSSGLDLGLILRVFLYTLYVALPASYHTVTSDYTSPDSAWVLTALFNRWELHLYRYSAILKPC